MINLYYHPISLPSLAPIFAAEAMKLSYERRVVDLQNGEQRSETFTSINPFQRVPALKEDGFTLSESGAILRFLARENANALYADDAKSQGRIDQWMDYIAHHIRHNVGRIQFNKFVARLIGQDSDEKSLAEAERFLAQNLPPIEAQLSRTKYLCGDDMSLADIVLLSALEPNNLLSLDLSGCPNLVKWLEAERGKPYYQNVHTHFGAELGL